MKPANYPIPTYMKGLKLDARGYPIFYIAYVNPTGKPHFTVNHTPLRIRCLRKDLCSICGRKLLRGRWFLGGPMSAFHPDGVYNDPPMHDECAHYALHVCPWLAVPNYSRSIADKAQKEISLKGGLALLDETQIPGRPAVFVAVMAVGQDYTRGTVAPYVKPHKPYRKIEYWQHGVHLDDETGRARVLAFLQADENKEQYSGVDTEILQEHHQIAEMALSLIKWALEEGNTAAALKAANTAKDQITNLMASQGVTQADLDKFLAHLPTSKVVPIGKESANEDT